MFHVMLNFLFRFHIENRPIPSADLFPDLAEDVLELTIAQCR